MRRWCCFLSIIIAVLGQDKFEDRRSKLPYIADAIGNTLPPPANGPGMVGSPSNLLTPDRYEFYTFDDSGELVKRLMTLEEIQAIVAAGDGTDGHLVTFANDDQPPIAFNFSQAPFTKVHSVVANVQNVLKAQMEAQKNNPPLNPSLDTPDVSDSWSLILPTIFGNTGGDIIPDISPSTHVSADTDVLELESPTNEESDNSLSKENYNHILSSEATIKPSSHTTESEDRLTQKVQLTEPAPKTTTTTTTTTSTTTTSKPKTTSTTVRPKYTTTYKPRSTTKTYTIKTNPTSTTKKATLAYKNPDYSTTTTTAKSSTTTGTSTTTSPTTSSTTAKPRTTSTTSTTTTTTTTPIPSSTTTTTTTTTTTAQPRTTLTQSTTNAPKIISTTIVPKSPSSTTTEKPRSSTSSSTTFATKSSSPKPIFGLKKPLTTTEGPSKNNSYATEKVYPQKDFTEISGGNYIPVSTMTRGTTNRNTVKITETTTVIYTPSHATTKRYATLSRGTTASPSTSSPSTIKTHPLVSTYKPNIASTVKIVTSKPVYQEKIENVTTITTQSVSPSISVSTTEYMDMYKEPVNVIQQDEPTIPIFDMAESFSQIASDLGNYQGPTTVDASKIAGSNLGLESKENLEIDIPNDTKIDNKDADSFVKLSSLKPQSSAPNFIYKQPSSTTNVPDILLNNSGPIDPILSVSMGDVMSQVFHHTPQTFLQTNDNSFNKTNASFLETGMSHLNLSKESYNKEHPKIEAPTKPEKQKIPNLSTKIPLVETTKHGVKSEITTSKPLTGADSTKKESVGAQGSKVSTTPSIMNYTNKPEIVKVETTTKMEMQKIEIITKAPEQSDKNYTKIKITNYQSSSKPVKQEDPTSSKANHTKGDIFMSDSRSTTEKPTFHKGDTLSLPVTSKNKQQIVTKPQTANTEYKNPSKNNVSEKNAITEKPIKYSENPNKITSNLVSTIKPDITTASIMKVANLTTEHVFKGNKTVEKNSILQSQKDSENKRPNQDTNNVTKVVQNQTEAFVHIHTSINQSLNPVQPEIKATPTITSTEKSKPYIEVKNNTKMTENNTTLDISNPKIEEFKKKIQKVNIDDKELGNNRNNSWKLIPTVSPPKTNEIQEKTPTDSHKHGDADDLHKDINLDVSKENQGLEVTTKDLGEDIVLFTELCNELAFRYWSEIVKAIDKKRSFVLSPYSITSMLAMMFMGARGATSGEMNDILKLDDMVTFNPHFTLKNISDSIETSPNEGVAVSAFVRELYSDRNKGKILTFYKERAHQFYGGHVEEVNFKLISDIIRRRTNLLIKRHTWGRIVEYMKTNSITMQPPLAAFSANVFQTDCTGSSVDGRDGEMYFVVSPNVRQRRLIPVPSVVYRSGFLAGYDPVLDATAAALGNTNSVVSTLFLMPGQQGNVVHADDLDALEKRLLESNPTTPTWNRLLRTLLPRMGLELQIPRFSHKSVFNVSETLKKMGLKDLFAPEIADLGGLNGPTKELYLSDMIQHTTFTTCGEGIVADQHHIEEYPEKTELTRRRRTSRWTSDWDEPRDYQRAFHDPHDVSDAMNLPLHLRPRQARLPSRNTQPARLKFDRPFLFFVRHNPTGMILYVGRYNPRLLP